MRRYLSGLALFGALLGSGHAVAGERYKLLQLEGQKVRWMLPVGSTGAAKVTYAFAKGPIETPRAFNCGRMDALDPLLDRSGIAFNTFKSEARAAFDMWEKAIELDFVEIDDPAVANIVIGAQAKPEGYAFANVEPGATLGHSGFRSIVRSRVCLNPERRWKVGFDGRLDSYDVRFTLAHEIGHAIGLDHPSPHGQLMSFRYEESFRELQAGDIMGAVALYPARTRGATRHASGNAGRILTVNQPVPTGSTATSPGEPGSLALGKPLAVAPAR